MQAMAMGLIGGASNLLTFLIVPVAGFTGLWAAFQWLSPTSSPKAAENGKTLLGRCILGVVIGLTFGTIILPEIRGWIGA